MVGTKGNVIFNIGVVVLAGSGVLLVNEVHSDWMQDRRWKGGAQQNAPISSRRRLVN